MQPHKMADEHDARPRLWRRLRCALREGHDPVHHPLGGFRCARCGTSATDLDQFGFEDEGYVSEIERRRLARAGEGGDRAA